MTNKKIYTATEEEVQRDRAVYKTMYPLFHPYTLSVAQVTTIGQKFFNVLTTQNGQDFDDYQVTENDRIHKYLQQFTPGKLLLLGVGTGRETKVALDMGFDVTGITLGSRNVEFGKRFMGLTASQHVETAVEAMSFPRETFDLIIGLQTFEHAIAPLLFLLDLGRVLKTNGQLLLEWPPGKTHHSGDNPHHQICYTPGQAHALMEKAGFGDLSLFFPDLSPIPEEQLWRTDQDQYMAVLGKKLPSNKMYIKRAWA